MRKSLGLNFVGETLEQGKMYIVDCAIEGFDAGGPEVGDSHPTSNLPLIYLSDSLSLG